jgi:hypothetical protein
LVVDLSTRHSLSHWAPLGARYRKVIALKGGNIDDIERINEADPNLRALPGWTDLVDALTEAERSAEALAILDELAAQSPGLASSNPEFSRQRGELLLLQTLPATAKPSEDLFRRALDFANQQGRLPLELRAATSLAHLLSTQGRRAEAIACGQPVYDRFTEGFGSVDLIAAKQLLNGLRDAGGQQVSLLHKLTWFQRRTNYFRSWGEKQTSHSSFDWPRKAAVRANRVSTATNEVALALPECRPDTVCLGYPETCEELGGIRRRTHPTPWDGRITRFSSVENLASF